MTEKKFHIELPADLSLSSNSVMNCNSTTKLNRAVILNFIIKQENNEWRIVKD